MKINYIVTILSSLMLSGQSKNVGINTENPSATLEILSKTNISTTKSLAVSNSSGTEMLTLLNNGNLGINVVLPISQIDVNSGGNSKSVLKINTMSSSNLRQSSAINYNNFARLVMDNAGHIISQYDFKTINSNAATFDGQYTTNGTANTNLITINKGSILRFVVQTTFAQGATGNGVVKYAEVIWSKERGFRIIRYAYDFAQSYNTNPNSLTVMGSGTNVLTFHVDIGDDLIFEVIGGNLVYRQVDQSTGIGRKEPFRIFKSMRTR